MKPLLSVIDHLVYATLDLPGTLRDLEARLGVAPAPGGRHPKWGTRNALLALGPRVYLEVVGPDRDASESERTDAARRSEGKLPFGLDSLSDPALTTWACRGEDLPAIVHTAGRLGINLGEVQRGSRQRPDGSTLAWTMTDLLQHREGGIIPFFIDWGPSPHPAESAPRGCALISLRAEHPDAGRIQAVLSSLGLDVPVTRGPRPSLTALISTPRGEVELR